MRFSGLHKLSTYLMSLAALAALLLSPEIGLPIALVTLVAVGLSWFAEPSRFRLERYTAAWNIATVLFLLYLVIDMVRGGAVITAGAKFLLFVLCNKLFNRRTSRDYLQVCVVSFLLLVVATTVNTSLSYAIAFAAYVVFATWALILLHLRREMEENYLLRHAEGAQSEKVEVERILSSRRVVGGRFLAGTSLLSLSVVLSSALIFVVFPRIGLGVFVSQKRGGVAVSGFQDRVELGHHGVVRDNPAVVMRVRFPDDRNPGPLRWRGSAFDRYRDGVWSHSPELLGWMQVVAPTDGLYVFNNAPAVPLRATPRLLRTILQRQEIYLEPLDSSVLFGADRPIAVEQFRRPIGGRWSQGMPRRGPLGEIRTSSVRSAGLQYVAYSQITAPPPTLLRQTWRLEQAGLQRFLQLPPELPARIGALAEQITRGQTTLYDKVMAVQEHLRRHYQYTLTLTHTPGLEPVDEFLFVTRRGHCEYFASAMVLLLRSVGIHARTVNGFAGGIWNRYGNYLAIRQGDAHSWVEVLFANVGWVTFDPTPPATPAAVPHGTMAAITDILDALRMRWYRYVIEYDLRQQVSMLRQAQSWLAKRPGPGSGVFNKRAVLFGLAALVLVIVAAKLMQRRRARRHSVGADRTSRPPPSPASQLYARLLTILARAGHAKPPGSTPREFVAQLGKAQFSPLELVERITGWYYQARFGGLAVPAQEEIAALLKQLQRELRPRRG